MKGKIRTILLPGKLCRKLRKYAEKNKITSGELFLTRRGNPLSRKQIWAEMKAVCQTAGVEASKVFPHNLRHLFARCFYQVCRDIAKLADVLGHSWRTVIAARTMAGTDCPYCTGKKVLTGFNDLDTLDPKLAEE